MIGPYADVHYSKEHGWYRMSGQVMVTHQAPFKSVAEATDYAQRRLDNMTLSLLVRTTDAHYALEWAQQMEDEYA